MSQYRNKLLLLCPAAVRDVANQAAGQVMGAGNEGTFTAAYSADGSQPATHYAANGVMTDGFVSELVALATNFPMIQGWVSGRANFTSLEDFANVHIVDDVDPHAILASIPLVPVNL